MVKRIAFASLLLLIGRCVEPYQFAIKDASPSLVIEAWISDKSFSETLSYPSDGRYFTVKLSETGDVTNARPVPVTGATVLLLTNDGETWRYTEEDAGSYLLLDKDFKARADIEYKLQITLSDENVFESGWQQMPDTEVPPMGEVGFTETEKQVYVMEALHWVLRTKKVAVANINVPVNHSGTHINYRWTYAPMWIYIAPLSSVIDPGHICWATDANYLNTFDLQIDRSGGYKKDLFFFPTIRNERIFEKFSVLVTQHEMTDGYFNFWKEMKDRNEGSRLNDVPPYNLQTNYFCTTASKRVSGFFGVVREQAKRWYFTRKDLSYNVTNTLRADCLVVYGPGPPALECTDCRGYSFGKATTTEPAWWEP